jgi:DNA-binding response OmpR family regulator
MRNVLLLEPDGLLADSISRYFAGADYKVQAHSDPQAAVTQADKQRPDVVITELQLAGRSGVEFLYEFRSYPEWQGVPVIIFTSLHSEDISAYQNVFSELNIQAYLYKPATSLKQLLLHTRQSLAAA